MQRADESLRLQVKHALCTLGRCSGNRLHVHTDQLVLWKIPGIENNIGRCYLFSYKHISPEHNSHLYEYIVSRIIYIVIYTSVYINGHFLQAERY